MSGRFPVHIYQAEGAPEPPLPDSGLPLGMTTIAEKLQAVGYHTMQAGKWCASCPLDPAPFLRAS